jgi:hypothetical protein
MARLETISQVFNDLAMALDMSLVDKRASTSLCAQTRVTGTELSLRLVDGPGHGDRGQKVAGSEAVSARAPDFGRQHVAVARPEIPLRFQAEGNAILPPTDPFDDGLPRSRFENASISVTSSSPTIAVAPSNHSGDGSTIQPRIETLRMGLRISHHRPAARSSGTNYLASDACGRCVAEGIAWASKTIPS